MCVDGRQMRKREHVLLHKFFPPYVLFTKKSEGGGGWWEGENREWGLQNERGVISKNYGNCPTPMICISLQTRATATPAHGVWDMRGKQFHTGVEIRKWAIACFASQHMVREDALRLV